MMANRDFGISNRKNVQKEARICQKMFETKAKDNAKVDML